MQISDKEDKESLSSLVECLEIGEILYSISKWKTGLDGEIIKVKMK